MTNQNGRNCSERGADSDKGATHMNNIIYIVGLIVIVVAVLSFIGIG